MTSLSKQTIHHNTYIKISLTSAVYWSVTSPSNSGLPPSRPSSTLARDLCWRGIVAHFDTLDGNCVAPVGFQSSKLWDQLQCWKSGKNSSCWSALLSVLSFSHSGKWEWELLIGIVSLQFFIHWKVKVCRFSKKKFTSCPDDLCCSICKEANDGQIAYPPPQKKKNFRRRRKNCDTFSSLDLRPLWRQHCYFSQKIFQRIFKKQQKCKISF